MKRVLSFTYFFVCISYLILTFAPFFHHHSTERDSSFVAQEQGEGNCLLCEATSSTGEFDSESNHVQIEPPQKVIDAEFAITLFPEERTLFNSKRFRIAPKTSPPA